MAEKESSALESFRDPLQEKIDAGEPAIGLYINHPNTVELAAHLGFDWFMLDQMFTSHGWQKTEELIRTAEAAGITPVVRVHSYPWAGGDPHVIANASRNIAIGADYVMISHSSTEEIERAIPLAHDYHKKESHVFPYDDYLPFGGENAPDEGLQAQIIPHVESRGAIDEIEEVMEIPEVDYCFIALSDSMQELTGEDRPDWNDPVVWEFVDRVVEIAERTDTVVGANPSFHQEGEDFTYSLEVIEDRVVELHDRGIQMIMAQSAPLFFQIAGGRLLDNLSDRLSM